MSKRTGKSVGNYEGVSVYESGSMGSGRYSGGVTLPGRGIIVGSGVYSKGLYPELMQHEFGHILQAKEVGMVAYYGVIAKESVISAGLHGKFGHDHNNFWTETWANYLSKNYRGSDYIFSSDFPIQNISTSNLIRLRLFSPLFWP